MTTTTTTNNGWTSEEKAENHWRRTFCQIPFVDIYEHADKGKRSLHGLVEFFRRKAQAERGASDELRELLHAQTQQADVSGGGGGSSLEDLEESGTSIRKALMEVRGFVDAACNHQLLLAKVLEEQVAEPLESLQEASEMYIRILRDEIKNVNDEYAAASSAHRQAAARLQKASEDLAEASERQRVALHGIGVPEFELQRLATRVAKCEDEKLQAEVLKAQAKNALYNRIIARDEMAMAVSVAYQKAEEERLDQLKSSLQRFVHVEKERLKVAERMLASLEQHIEGIDRSEDIQLLIHNRRNPDNMHFQGKALALLDWHWGKMQTEQAQSWRRRGHSSDSDAGERDSERRHHVSFARSSSGAGAISSDPVVVPRPSASRGSGSSASDQLSKPPSSPHGELARSPMGLALRRYFANDPSPSAGAAAPSSHEATPPPVENGDQRVASSSLDVDEAATAATVIESSSSPGVALTTSPTAMSSAETDQDEADSEAVASADAALGASDDATPAAGAAAAEADAPADGSQTQADPASLASPPSSSSSSSSPSTTTTLPAAVVKRLCTTQSGRAMFVKCLNRQRSLETKIKDQASFDELADCFGVFLDECIREDDVKAAKTAMILAETFYLPRAGSGAAEGDRSLHAPALHHHGGVDRGATRMYLQEEVKRHAIWKNPSFWEKALLLAIGEELQKTPQHAPWEDLPSGVPKPHDAAGLPTREEAVGRVHNIVFGQLGSFTLSMLEFDVPLAQIESFVETMCDAHELTEDQRFLLRKSLQEIFATLR